MDTHVSDLLQLVAEVAIATVALSGITMVLLIGGTDVSRRKVAMITIQLRMSSVVAIAAVLPLVLAVNGFGEAQLWLVASPAYLLMILATAIYVIVSRKLTQEMTPGLRLMGTFPAFTSLLLIANLWLASPWPYLTQLFIAWATSLLMFLSFIQLILDERTHQG